MNKSKFYTAEKEINGKKYVAQFSGVSTAIRAIDSSYIEGSNVTSSEKLGEYILKHIIVEPAGLTLDDFDTLEEFNDVVGWGRDVMYGKFRSNADSETGKEKSK